MELKKYWAVIRRRLWIIVVLTLIAGIASVWFSPKVQTSYVATIRVMVSVTPEAPKPGVYQFDNYYTWISSEYLVDDLSEMVKSQAFVDDLRKALTGKGIDPAAIQGATNTKKSHRLLSISFTAPREDWAAQIAGTAGTVLGAQATSYLAQLSYEKPQYSIVDPPVVVAQTSGMRSNMDIALRTALGFIAGLALVLLLEYIDSSVRDANELEELLRVPVLAEVPPFTVSRFGFFRKKNLLP